MNFLFVFAYEETNISQMKVHTPPLGIGYMAAFLKQAGHSVRAVDLQVQHKQDVFDNMDGVEMVGISILTNYFEHAVDLVSELRERGFNGKIVLGGPHVTALAEESLRDSGADYACVSEGEEVMLDFAAGKPGEEIPGICWIENGEFRQNPMRAFNKPLDEYPFPAIEVFQLERYGSYNMTLVSPSTRDGIIMTSRGCPFRCDFCYRDDINKRMRMRSAENIVAEIKQLKERYGYRKYSFIDDCFNANIKQAKRICQAIIDAKLDIIFTLPNGMRADLVDDELAGLMKKAGCIGANIGVESWDEGVAEKMDKRLKKDEVINAVQLFRKHGIICTAYFIMGHYWDTKESVKRNIEAVKELGADFFQFTNFVPVPGSPAYNMLRREGLLDIKSFREYSLFGSKLLFKHPILSETDIHSSIRIANQKAAFRLRTLVVMLKRPIILWNVFRQFGQIMALTKITEFGRPPDLKMSTNKTEA
ncbi:B12-binding domain-containing radical SAM protein [Magnetofaba australis]|uniref:Putative radical SAM protein n=1 Tax=Magnetofaba australis IT-1 TaxID=1434232 RepID=A0A1Y2K8T5_9PROT|nr:radical SAM protein [Magnetofaba australis]OSM07039.1 putative radical SAM protein [Magnetofaba australis IT-1]